jgi:adenylate cyclase
MVGARWLRLLAVPVLAALWGAALGAAHLQGQAPALDRVEAALTDLRTLARGQTRPPDLVTIVAIDDAVVEQEKAYPLPRATLARIIERIADLSPKAIALDLLLVEPGPGEGDRLLAQALSRRPSVIAGAATFTTSGRAEADAEGPLARVPVADQFLLPMSVFAEAAQTGIVNVATDQDGVPRSAPLLFRTAERIEEALPLRVAAAATGSDPVIEPSRVTVGGKSIQTDLGQNLPLAFYGPRGTIRTLSAADVLNGRIEPQGIEGRIVVIGATVTAGGDVFPTPFDPVLPGVEVISTAISNLMAGDGPVRDFNVRLADTAIAIVLPAVLVSLLAWRRNVVGLAAIAGVLIAWAIVNMLAFEHGIWMSAALPLAAAAPPTILFGAGQIWLQRRRAHHFARQATLLQRVQAPGMAHLLAQDPEFLKEPVRQNAAVVFVDLSGFTGLSEMLGAAGTRELLDAFYDRVDAEATACGGAITSFTGDGAMILFGLPVSDVSDAAAAARCAIGLCRSMSGWLGSLPASIAPRIGFKIGAHYGIVVISRLGHGRTQQIAATGDTVNVASRLMEVAARSGAELAVSDDLLQAAGRAAFEPGVLSGPFETRLRGRAHPLSVWTASNMPAQPAAPPVGGQ